MRKLILEKQKKIAPKVRDKKEFRNYNKIEKMKLKERKKFT